MDPIHSTWCHSGATNLVHPVSVGSIRFLPDARKGHRRICLVRCPCRCPDEYPPKPLDLERSRFVEAGPLVATHAVFDRLRQREVRKARVDADVRLAVGRTRWAVAPESTSRLRYAGLFTSAASHCAALWTQV